MSYDYEFSSWAPSVLLAHPSICQGSRQGESSRKLTLPTQTAWIIQHPPQPLDSGSVKLIFYLFLRLCSLFPCPWRLRLGTGLPWTKTGQAKATEAGVSHPDVWGTTGNPNKGHCQMGVSEQGGKGADTGVSRRGFKTWSATSQLYDPEQVIYFSEPQFPQLWDVLGDRTLT